MYEIILTTGVRARKKEMAFSSAAFFLVAQKHRLLFYPHCLNSLASSSVTLTEQGRCCEKYPQRDRIRRGGGVKQGTKREGRQIGVKRAVALDRASTVFNTFLFLSFRLIYTSGIISKLKLVRSYPDR